jgi:hypothetical protein
MARGLAGSDGWRVIVHRLIPANMKFAAPKAIGLAAYRSFNPAINLKPAFFLNRPMALARIAVE